MLNSLQAIIALILSIIFLVAIFAIGIFVVIVIVRAIVDSFRSLKKSQRGNDKQQVIRGYSKHLGKQLQHRYGVRERYTPKQIKDTIRSSGLSTDLDCYGIAMYAERNDFIEYHRAIGETCDYDAMRDEIGQCLSLPDNTFSPSEAIDASDRFDDRSNVVDESHSNSENGGSWSFWSDSSSDTSSSSSYDGGGGSDSGGGFDGGSSSD